MLEVRSELLKVLVTDSRGGDGGFVVANIEDFRGVVRVPGVICAIGGGGGEWRSVGRGGAGGGVLVPWSAELGFETLKFPFQICIPTVATRSCFGLRVPGS